MILLLLGLLFTSASQAAFECETSYDQLDIPHVSYSSEEEFYYCFGLHHGKDRAWQMDYFRRVAQGRNAEVLGFSQLKTDLMMRLLDLPSFAEKLYASVPEEKWAMLKHYAAGVNEGFKTGKNAQEFIDQGFAPEEWKPVHSLMVLLIQSFDQTRKTFFREYEEELFKETWGNRSDALFNEDDLPWETTILKKGEYPTKEAMSAKASGPSKLPRLWAMFPSVFGEESGSNSWAISAKRASGGFAILANDPHLDLKTPIFWYWMKLKSKDHTILGGSLPGLPIVISGTNGKVAWGLTNSYINTADAAFLTNLKSDDLESVRPLVWIKFGLLKLPFLFKSFERLKTGQPILPLETEYQGKMGLRWSGFSITADDIQAMFELRNVKNITEMDLVLSRVGVPTWNFNFADSKGEIGFRLVGNAYKIHAKLPYGVPHLTKEEFLKEEFLTPEERPHLLRPNRGYSYTANNRHWPMDARYYGGRAYAFGFRAKRIEDLLEFHSDVESSKNIQCDVRANDAVYFVPKLLEIIDDKELRSWDFMVRDDSKALPIYRRLMSIILKEWKINEAALWHLLPELSMKQKQEIIAFHQRAIKDIAGRSWSEVQRLSFDHLSKKEDWVFSKAVSGVGDRYTVNPGTNRWVEEKKIFEHYSGASMRMIIEMTKTPKVQLVLPGYNRNYTEKRGDSPWQDWTDCKYYEVKF